MGITSKVAKEMPRLEMREELGRTVRVLFFYGDELFDKRIFGQMFN